MESYLWLFPLLFIFHDMEEIIGFKIWYEKNKGIVDKYPKIKRMFNGYSTEGMAVAVFEELLLCIIICALASIFNWYGLWIGGFIAYTIHLIVHIGQALLIRMYTPSLATSIICFPISIYIINKSIVLLDYSVFNIILYSIIGIVIVVVNLMFAHYLMKKFTIWMMKK